MSSGSNDPVAYVVVGFFGGLYYFYKGFKSFRKVRVIEDTPATHIRGIPMGLVDIQGRATGEETLLSPVTHTPCYLCRVDVEEWHTDSKGGGSWKHAATDIQSVKFYLEDPTGRVLIDAAGAELDLPPGAKRDVRSGQHASPGAGRPAGNMAPATGNPVSDVELLRYVNEARMRHYGQMAGRVVGLISRGANAEHAQGRDAFLRFLANPTGDAGGDFAGLIMRNTVARQDPRGETSRAALELWKCPRDSPAFQVNLENFARSYARVLAGAGHFRLPENLSDQIHEYSEQAVAMSALLAGAMEPQADPELEKARQAALAHSHAVVSSATRHEADAATGSYRLTESCLVPGGSYSITGTCTENPSPRDEQDRNMIVKGRNESTYIISYRSHKEEERHFAGRSLLQVFGGAAASVACLAYILYRLHMF
jgi:hypothetical protein